MRYLLLFLFFLSAIKLQIGYAQTPVQNNGDWQVIFYERSTHSVIKITADYVQVIELADELISNYTDDVESYPSNISPDGRYFLLTFTPYGGTSNPTFLIDLTTPQAYIKLPEPELNTDEIFVGYNHWQNGSFSPDGTKVALAYVSHDITSSYGCCGSGGIVTIDLTTESVMQQLTLDAFLNPDVNTLGNTAWMGDWAENGIEFSPRCSNCTPPDDFIYYLWNPDSNAFTKTSKFDNERQVDRLATTGEFIYGHSHPDYPPGDGYYGYVDQRSAIELFQENEIPFKDTGQVIFYDTGFIGYSKAHWVANGQGFIVIENQKGVFILRDGQRLDFEATPASIFLGMTANGWLLGDTEDGLIMQYAYVAGQLIVSEVVRLTGQFQPMGVVNLPTARPDEVLPSFDINIPPPDVVFCPGSLASNLKSGDIAEIIFALSGAPLVHFRIYDADGIDWPNDFRMLAVGEIVTVIDGPRCDNPGLLYWTVEHNGRFGEMIEVARSTYYMQPIKQ